MALVLIPQMPFGPEFVLAPLAQAPNNSVKHSNSVAAKFDLFFRAISIMIITINISLECFYQWRIL